MASNHNAMPCLPYDKEAETIDEFLTRFSLQTSDQLHHMRNNERKQVVLLMKALPVSVFKDVQSVDFMLVIEVIFLLEFYYLYLLFILYL